MGEKLRSKELCESIKSKLVYKTTMLLKKGITPTIVSLLIGEDGGAKFYTRIQKKKCDEIGIDYRLIQLKSHVTIAEIKKNIDELNKENGVHGIIIQTPLPKNLIEENIMELINPEKDVDCQTLVNIGKLYKGEKAYAPCTAESAVSLCKSTGIELCGKNVVVIGRSNIVGKPLLQLLLGEHATVTICHSRTDDVKEKCKKADVIFACAGRPKMIDESFVKKGAIIIDIGTSEVNGRITGDVDIENALKKAAFVSTVPGGVGPLTTMILLNKIVENASKDLK